MDRWRCLYKVTGQIQSGVYVQHGIDKWRRLDEVTGQIESGEYTTWDR